MKKSIVCWLWNDGKPATPTLMPSPPAAPVHEQGLSPDLRRLIEKQRRMADRYPSRPELRAAYNKTRASLRAPKRNNVLSGAGHRRLFAPEHVNVLQKMFARHLPEKHRFICISDSKEGLSDDVEWLETPPEAAALASIGSPEGERFPSCYRRLWVFSDAARVLGDRLLCIDIDLVVTGDMTPIFDHPQDFVGWRPFRDWGRKLRFGGGQYLLTTGSRTKVWDRFKGVPSILEAREAGFRGSDQAWLSYCLAGDDREAYWPNTSGLYSVRDLGPSLDLPRDARLVQFNGHQKPWDYTAIGAPEWVMEHWR